MRTYSLEDFAAFAAPPHARPTGSTGSTPRADLSPEEAAELEAQLRDALARLPNESREEWLEVGAVLRACGLDEHIARAVWDDWSSAPGSAGEGKYDAKDQDRVWGSFMDSGQAARAVEAGQRVLRVGTVFKKAREAGWKPPSDRSDPREAFAAFLDAEDGSERTSLGSLERTKGRIKHAVADNVVSVCKHLGINIRRNVFAEKNYVVDPDGVLLRHFGVASGSVLDDDRVEQIGLAI
ncbi:MAG: PriCT-2 domain-containing protein, partial [Actinobacteria bacterium]|nr:PriCT-2 domain-containing protein [Actinomycetota bacterium]